MSQGLSFEESLKIPIYTAVLTSLLTFIGFWLKNKFDFTFDDQKFKRELAATRLKELYLELYAVIAQSEYVRIFHAIPGDFNEVPFLEISKTRRSIKSDLFTQKVESVTEEERKDAITDFNKINIASSIIDNGKHASQDLLKLAVAYRYVHQHYLDESISNVDKFREEELRLIREIVQLIVRETNINLRLCKLDYSQKEIDTGIMQVVKNQEPKIHNDDNLFIRSYTID